MSGRTTHFYTALTLLNSRTGHLQTGMAENFVTLRKLSDQDIEDYLLKEQPYHCAGSAKTEGLGHCTDQPDFRRRPECADRTAADPAH